eukprot:Gb_06579 [translate_table: standard]
MREKEATSEASSSRRGRGKEAEVRKVTEVIKKIVVTLKQKAEADQIFSKEGEIFKGMINHLLNVIILKSMDILHLNVGKG